MPQKPRYAFVIDVSRCIDCRACLAACSIENQVAMDATRIWVQDLGVQGAFPDLKRTFVPYNCMHCDHPPCVEVCVSSATFKDPESGLVLVDQDACIGCGFCVDACPYNVRYLDSTRGVVDKCNACQQRLEAGLKPACVATCVGQSRLFGDLNDPNSEASKALQNARSITRLDYEKDGSRYRSQHFLYQRAGDRIDRNAGQRTATAGLSERSAAARPCLQHCGNWMEESGRPAGAGRDWSVFPGAGDFLHQTAH